MRQVLPATGAGLGRWQLGNGLLAATPTFFHPPSFTLQAEGGQPFGFFLAQPCPQPKTRGPG
jgi:hypothetical protein